MSTLSRDPDTLETPAELANHAAIELDNISLNKQPFQVEAITKLTRWLDKNLSIRNPQTTDIPLILAACSSLAEAGIIPIGIEAIPYVLRQMMIPRGLLRDITNNPAEVRTYYPTILTSMRTFCVSLSKELASLEDNQ